MGTKNSTLLLTFYKFPISSYACSMQTSQWKVCGDKLSRIGTNGFLETTGKTTLKMVSDDSVNLSGFSMRFEGKKTVIVGFRVLL